MENLVKKFGPSKSQVRPAQPEANIDLSEVKTEESKRRSRVDRAASSIAVKSESSMTRRSEATYSA